MKLEILKKLIALANNNPNDNEANLAARKVCKALVEDKHIDRLIEIAPVSSPKTRVTNPTTPPKSPPNYRPNPGSQQEYYEQYDNPFESGPFSDIFEEYFRSTRNRQYTKTPPKHEKQKGYQQYKPKSDELKERENTWQYEFFVAASREYYNPMTRKHYKMMFQDLWFHETGARHVSDTAAFRAGANYGQSSREGDRQKDEYDFFGNRKKKDEKRHLKCKTCGKVTETKFVGIEEMFECNQCQWDFHERNKKPPKEERKYKNVCHMTGSECKTPVSCAGMGCQHRT